MTPELLAALVDLALPKPCQFGLENFAGDPLVRSFCKRLEERNALDLTFFVSWACPPDVLILRGPGGGAVVRSERLDTLLVEYYNLKRAHQVVSADLAEELVTATILRWLCEMLIGYRQPELAVLAYAIRPPPDTPKIHSAFRDETLASIDPLARTALQCFALAHEVGHIVNPPRDDASLDLLVDGIAIVDHLRFGDVESGHPVAALAAHEALWRERLAARMLVNEIEADLFAFAAVVDYLCNGLSFELEEAIDASLQAFEAQLFLCACKNGCRLLAEHASGRLDKEAFIEQDYLVGAEYIARARTVVRRAGITWAIAEHEPEQAGEIAFDDYVRRIDAMLTPAIAFRSTMSTTLRLYEDVLTRLCAEPEVLATALDRVASDSELRLALFYILIAFGCPGSVDVGAYLRSIGSVVQRVA